MSDFPGGEYEFPEGPPSSRTLDASGTLQAFAETSVVASRTLRYVASGAKTLPAADGGGYTEGAVSSVAKAGSGECGGFGETAGTEIYVGGVRGTTYAEASSEVIQTKLVLPTGLLEANAETQVGTPYPTRLYQLEMQTEASAEVEVFSKHTGVSRAFVSWFAFYIESSNLRYAEATVGAFAESSVVSEHKKSISAVTSAEAEVQPAPLVKQIDIQEGVGQGSCESLGSTLYLMSPTLITYGDSEGSAIATMVQGGGRVYVSWFEFVIPEGVGEDYFNYPVTYGSAEGISTLTKSIIISEGIANGSALTEGSSVRYVPGFLEGTVGGSAEVPPIITGYFIDGYSPYVNGSFTGVVNQFICEGSGQVVAVGTWIVRPEEAESSWACGGIGASNWACNTGEAAPTWALAQNISQPNWTARTPEQSQSWERSNGT